MLPHKLSQHFTEITSCIQHLFLLAHFTHHDLHDQSLQKCFKILHIMTELHFQNINHYNTISPYIHLKILDSLSFSASNVLDLFSSNSFSFSWHLKWCIVSSSASNIACGEQKIYNSGQFMHERFLVAGLMYIKSRGYMLCIIYSILSVKNNHEWVCSLHKYIQNSGWKTFNLLQEVLKSLRRSRQRWEYNIRMECKERGLNGVHWFHLAQDRVKMARLLWIW